MDGTTAEVSAFPASSLDVASAQAHNVVMSSLDSPSDNNFGEYVKVFGDNDEKFTPVAEVTSDYGVSFVVTRSDFVNVSNWPSGTVGEHELNLMRAESRALYCPVNKRQVGECNDQADDHGGDDVQVEEGIDYPDAPSSTTKVRPYSDRPAAEQPLGVPDEVLPAQPAEQTTDLQAPVQPATPDAASASASTTEQVEAGPSNIHGKDTSGSPSKQPLKDNQVLNHAGSRPTEVVKAPCTLPAEAIRRTLAAIVAADNVPNARGSRSGAFCIPTAATPRSVEQTRCVPSGRPLPRPSNRNIGQPAVPPAAPVSTAGTIKKGGSAMASNSVSPAVHQGAREVTALNDGPAVSRATTELAGDVDDPSTQTFKQPAWRPVPGSSEIVAKLNARLLELEKTTKKEREDAAEKLEKDMSTVKTVRIAEWVSMKRAREEEEDTADQVAGPSSKRHRL